MHKYRIKERKEKKEERGRGERYQNQFLLTEQMHMQL
jgi:hypothetical protein